MTENAIIETLDSVPNKSKSELKQLYREIAERWCSVAGSHYELDDPELFFDNLFQCYNEVAKKADGKRFEEPLEVTLKIEAQASEQQALKKKDRRGSITCKFSASAKSQEKYAWLPLFFYTKGDLREWMTILTHIMLIECWGARKAYNSGDVSWTRDKALEQMQNAERDRSTYRDEPTAIDGRFILKQKKLCLWCLEEIENCKSNQDYGGEYCQRQAIAFTNQLKSGKKKGSPAYNIVTKIIKTQEKLIKEGSFHKNRK